MSLMHKYLQYSKRIAIFGIAQWTAIAIVVLAFMGALMFTGTVVDEPIASVLKSMITSSSTIAIAVSGGYYAHSAYDNTLKQKVENTLNASCDCCDHGGGSNG